MNADLLHQNKGTNKPLTGPKDSGSGADGAPVRAIYRADLPIHLSASKIKTQSPEDWIDLGMSSLLPPEYALPADIADMQRPAGMTRYQCKLMHLVFATLCRNRSPKFTIGRSEIGKFVTGDEKNIRSDRIVDTITGLAEHKFVFAATGLRREQKAWDPISLFASAPVITRDRIAFEIHNKIYACFLEPKIYEFISLSVIVGMRSETALAIYPVTAIKERVALKRKEIRMRKALNFDDAKLDTDTGLPYRVVDLATWTGVAYKEPARIMSDLKRASKMLEKDFGDFPRLTPFGVQKTEAGKVYKDEDGHKYISVQLEKPVRPIFYDSFRQNSFEEHYMYKLNATEGFQISPGRFRATAIAAGLDPTLAINAKAVKTAWVTFAVGLGDQLFDESIKSVYAKFHEWAAVTTKKDGGFPIPTQDEATEASTRWNELISGKRVFTKPSGDVPDLASRPAPEPKAEPDEEAVYDLRGLRLKFSPVRRHSQYPESYIGSHLKRDPRDPSVLLDANTNLPLEEGSFAGTVLELMDIKVDQIPFLDLQDVNATYRKRGELPDYVQRLLDRQKKR